MVLPQTITYTTLFCWEPSGLVTGGRFTFPLYLSVYLTPFVAKVLDDQAPQAHGDM